MPLYFGARLLHTSWKPLFSQSRHLRTLGHIGRKTWNVNGAIDVSLKPSYYIAEPIGQEPYLEKALNGEIVVVAGARASGKTTRMFQLMLELEKQGHLCIPISLDGMELNSGPAAFWTSFCASIQDSLPKNRLAPIRSGRDFLTAFRADKKSLQKKSIVLVIDEFSDLDKAEPVIQDQFLRTFRHYKQYKKLYAIHSVVACGTFSSLHLSSTSLAYSPFNVANYVQVPYFSQEQTAQLFDEFAKDWRVTIDPSVVRDIWMNSNGHPGMVGVCGRAILENLSLFEDRNVSYQRWQDYSIKRLGGEITSYMTFRSLRASLRQPQSQEAVSLLRYYFAGFLGEVEISDENEMQRRLAEFLASEGVLLKHDLRQGVYHMASPLIDRLIRSQVIPHTFPSAPTIDPPARRNGRLAIIRVVAECVKLFDKDIIRRASLDCFKCPDVAVNGVRKSQVPRESVYDTELMRILVNWLPQRSGFRVLGQWRMQDGAREDDLYCDIVVNQSGKPIVLELVATETPAIVRNHFSKTVSYRKTLAAHDAWVIHFTLQDGYLDHAVWQTEEQLENGVNVIHFWHDREFSKVLMSARWKGEEGETHQIDNHSVIC